MNSSAAAATSFGEGRIARPRRLLLGSAYLLGSAGAGALHLASWAALGWLVQRAVPLPLALVGAAAGLALLRDAGLVPIPYPQRHWQVPANWVAQQGLASALRWSILLGFGVFTFLPYASFFVGVVAAIWSGDPLIGALLGAAYGIGRAVPTLAALWRPALAGDLFLGYLRTRPIWARIVVAMGLAVVLATALAADLPS